MNLQLQTRLEACWKEPFQRSTIYDLSNINFHLVFTMQERPSLAKESRGICRPSKANDYWGRVEGLVSHELTELTAKACDIDILTLVMVNLERYYLKGQVCLT